ncbi:hypothetical protein ABKN59_008546 [Abortiporus biennis]
MSMSIGQKTQAWPADGPESNQSPAASSSKRRALSPPLWDFGNNAPFNRDGTIADGWAYRPAEKQPQSRSVRANVAPAAKLPNNGQRVFYMPTQRDNRLASGKDETTAASRSSPVWPPRPLQGQPPRAQISNSRIRAQPAAGPSRLQEVERTRRHDEELLNKCVGHPASNLPFRAHPQLSRINHGATNPKQPHRTLLNPNGGVRGGVAEPTKEVMAPPPGERIVPRFGTGPSGRFHFQPMPPKTKRIQPVNNHGVKPNTPFRPKVFALPPYYSEPEVGNADDSKPRRHDPPMDGRVERSDINPRNLVALGAAPRGFIAERLPGEVTSSPPPNNGILSPPYESISAHLLALREAGNWTPLGDVSPTTIIATPVPRSQRREAMPTPRSAFSLMEGGGLIEEDEGFRMPMTTSNGVRREALRMIHDLVVTEPMVSTKIKELEEIMSISREMLDRSHIDTVKVQEGRLFCESRLARRLKTDVRLVDGSRTWNYTIREEEEILLENGDHHRYDSDYSSDEATTSNNSSHDGGDEYDRKDRGSIYKPHIQKRSVTIIKSPLLLSEPFVFVASRSTIRANQPARRIYNAGQAKLRVHGPSRLEDVTRSFKE